MYDDNKTHILNDDLPTGFSLEDILEEYGGSEKEQPADSLGERSRRIVMDAAGANVSEASFSSIDDLIGDAVEQAELETQRQSVRPKREKTVRRAQQERKKAQKEAPTADGRTPETVGLAANEQTVDAGGEAGVPGNIQTGGLDAENGDYASESFTEKHVPDSDERAEKREKLKERFLSPIIAVMALIALKRSQRAKADDRVQAAPEEDENLPEMEPEKAAKLYGSQLRSLKLRTKMAAVMSLFMVYLTFAYYTSLPLLGALGSGVRAIALVLMIFELTVMMIGLDVITSGLAALARLEPGVESLTAVSCILSFIDSAVLAAMNSESYGLPFCAVSALSLTFALWGSMLTCRGYRSGFRLLAMSKKLYTVSGENDVAGTGVALMKSHRPANGFISRSEEADITEYAYAVITPLVLTLSLIFGLLTAIHGQGKAFVHCLSVMVACSATFSAAVCFALPFSVASRRLFQSGAAVAGWPGVRDIGRSRRVVITDGDVFPPGTVEISGIRILEGAFTDKVISYTGSVCAASGSGLAAPFAELIRRNGYSISRVESFSPHDGGGMTAVVSGETVYVGSTGFMNLMGIRVPQKLAEKTSVFTAINGSLVGIFNISYKPTASVQEALAMLLRSNREPVFAIRDFNITPMMIKKKFRMPTDIFEFPPYSERYRISGTEPDENSKVSAVITREGMAPLVDAAERGRRVYDAARIGMAVSAVGSVFGVIMMFLLCWVGAFDSATASNALIFMLLWLMPTLVMSWGLQR